MSKDSHEIIEYEISDSISLMYDKSDERFYIYEIDFENGFDEYEFDVEEPFDDFELDGVFIHKQDFEYFKSLIKETA